MNDRRDFDKLKQKIAEKQSKNKSVEKEMKEMKEISDRCGFSSQPLMKQNPYLKENLPTYIPPTNSNPWK